MHLETFAHGHSPLHRLDPRAKLLAAGVLSVILAVSPVPGVWVTGLVLAICSVFIAQLPLGGVAKRLAAVNVFVAFLWLFLPWRLVWNPAGGGVLGLAWNPGGLFMAWAITIKANAIVLFLMSLLSTSTVNQLFHALAHLKAPNKLVHLFLFFYRYLHVLHQEYHRLLGAMRVRGFTPRTNLHTYRSYANLVGMLLVKSFDRAERVYAAMRCRGFDGTLWLLDHFNWGRRENLFMAICCLAAGGLAAWSLGAAWS